MKSKPLIFFAVLLFVFLAWQKIGLSQSSDAIAIRVMPNPEHKSIERWYKGQGFSGSPQTLTVDGYEAIRDGRTVYVNVANVNVAGSLFTNIYLISYNQNASVSTTDIFGNIIANWKFNSNLFTNGYCRFASTKSCMIDEDCSIGDYCRSAKARTIRDVKRLADINDIRYYLKSYYSGHGKYPNLSAGSYLPNKTYSIWPSWQNSFGKELGSQLPFDPVNQFGECPGYNLQTCWSDANKRFATNPPDMPEGSLTYYYFSDIAGMSADVCMVSESGFTISPAPSCVINVCLDFDNDGYGYPASASCDVNLQDCNDGDPLINVPSPENCSNGIDDNCNGMVDCFDAVCLSDASCAVASVCGDSICDIASGETCPTCPECCAGTVCGDGTCDAGECSTCYNFSGPTASADCFCGDNITCSVQSEDCDGGASCDSSCQDIILACTDNDGDLYIDETTNVAECNAQAIKPCGPVGGLACLGNNDCDDGNFARNPGIIEQCDGVDHDCDGNPANGLDLETCNVACGFAGFTWTGNLGILNCCGNDSGEGRISAGTFQSAEDTPMDFCSDGIDNDCDGGFDNDSVNPTNPDSECLPCDSDLHLSEDAWYWSTPVQPDCNQCNLAGDNDGDQEDTAGEWLSAYPAQPGLADKCDIDCIDDGATISNLSQTVHIDFYESNESTCNDVYDNDCDGLMNCNDPDCLGSPLCVFSCLGADPSNATLCEDDDDSLSADTAKTLVPACTLGQKCEYECNFGFYLSFGNCVRDCYADTDGDGFGNNLSVAQFSICPGTGSYVDDNTDCDDTKPYVYPGAEEQCNNLDSDCNASTPVDVGCDDDGDDYCESGMDWFPVSLACSASNDCDDNPLTCGSACSPGIVSESVGLTCSDGFDNDCDTFVDCDDIADCATDSACLDATEICSTPSIDEDGDGCFDSMDSDCGGTEDCSASLPGDDDCDGLDNASDPDCSASSCTFTLTFPCTF